METIVSFAQIVIAAGLVNVWLIRSRRETPYRGGAARTMREEFAEYGLPSWSMFAVGTAKVALAIALVAALWAPALRAPAALGVAALMTGALVMHARIRDPLRKSMPALSILALALLVSFA